MQILVNDTSNWPKFTFSPMYLPSQPSHLTGSITHCLSLLLTLSLATTSACLSVCPGCECRSMSCFFKHSYQFRHVVLAPYIWGDCMHCRSWLLTLVFSLCWGLGFSCLYFGLLWVPRLGIHVISNQFLSSFPLFFCPRLWYGCPLGGTVSSPNWVCEPLDGASPIADNDLCLWVSCIHLYWSALSLLSPHHIYSIHCLVLPHWKQYPHVGHWCVQTDPVHGVARAWILNISINMLTMISEMGDPMATPNTCL